MCILKLSTLLLAATSCLIVNQGVLASGLPSVATEPIEVVVVQETDPMDEIAFVMDNIVYAPVLEQEDPKDPRDVYNGMVEYIHERHFPELDTSIVKAVIETESHYDPTVQSPYGAIGIMQVIPKYHQHRIEKYGLYDLWDPYNNILAGMDLLNESYQKYGNYRDALYVYNHSDAYVNHVLALAEQIRGGD